ncbi:glutamate--tRNA ligase [Blastomonas aquatica]|uniref:Glutamate--tRNA ligase n=1 Tax=Blastomonas aquatica TaxID=1510276 RepID=A0ABQ1JC96_9SPHN|nr:glutamate--tRNA ligase [Blastomonas aquatica]GGB65237.1 glutamate--tRNA ligase 2 [Blastomonas aquatica]
MSASGENQPETAASTDRQVVTRFAPSPTGYLHIGGARTAMFNWLFARHYGGKALLRIEDTDKARSTPEAIDAIFAGLDWLGLDWDDAPVFQSARAERHAEVAYQLLDAGNAYKCFATSEELEAMRAEQREKKLPLRYDGRWRNRDASEAPEGAPFVIRLKAPEGGKLTIADEVQGSVTVDARELDDYVLLRSDGTPTYMLAVVVDDHDMGVTHIIRGDDHLNNAFRQLVLIRAMEWAEPVYAHIPLIHGNDGAKLSKRHGALGVEAYRDDMGIVSDAMFNYLLRLGWGYGDREKISRAEATELFALANVGKSPSRFDAKKLVNLNGQYLREMDDAALAALVAPRVATLMPGFDPAVGTDLLARAMPVMKLRARDLNELADGAQFLFKSRPIGMDDKAKSLLEGDGIAVLQTVFSVLAETAPWTAATLEDRLTQFAEEQGHGLGTYAQPLRAALTGQARSPGIFDVLELLGREESLARITDVTRVAA